MVAAHAYATVDEILENAKSRGEAPLIVLCDDLSDPHNLGAIIRTAECAGAHGVIIPKRRSVGLTAVVGKASAGALEYLPVARVSNLVSTIRDLQKAGVWVFGTAADGDTGLYAADLKGPAAIVIGNEGEGMSRLVSEACDFKVSIPMHGRISSLNASNAAAISRSTGSFSPSSSSIAALTNRSSSSFRYSLPSAASFFSLSSSAAGISPPPPSLLSTPACFCAGTATKENSYASSGSHSTATHV